MQKKKCIVGKRSPKPRTVSGFIGVDEAGRGAWAGPVVAGACIFLRNSFLKTSLYKSIDDSKKITPKRRSVLFDELVIAKKCGDVLWGVGTQTSEDVDTYGIKEANRRAMEQALCDVLSELQKCGDNFSDSTMDGKKSIEIHIDGNDHYIFPILPSIFPKEIQVLEHIGGDHLFKEIGAASIIAKVTRDRYMESLDLVFPDYQFGKHKGYGTRLHEKALREFGVLKIHRKSYFPIKHLILSLKKL